MHVCSTLDLAEDHRFAMMVAESEAEEEASKILSSYSVTWKAYIGAMLSIQNLWRIGNLLMTGFFSLASYVQHNDPDGWLWMVAYGIPAFLCVLQSFRPSISDNILWRYMTSTHLVLCACGEAYILCHVLLTSPAADQETQQWFEREETREFAGLLLVTSWLTLCILHANCRQTTSPPRSVVLLAILLVLTPFILWAAMHFRADHMTAQPDHCQGAFRMPSFAS